MPGYVQPQFNLQVGIWRNGSHLYNPPDVTSTANLSPGRVLGVALPEGLAVPIGPGGMWLRLPKGTDIRDAKAAAGADTVEVPRSSQRFYTVQWVDDIGCGFTNEHRFAVIQAFGPWLTPFWSTGNPFPPPLPYPPTLVGSGSTGGVALNNYTYNVVCPSAGNLITVVQLGLPFGVLPAVNGNAALGGSNQQYGFMPNQHQFAVWHFPIGAGVTAITVAMPMPQNRVMSGFSMFENYLTPPLQASNVNAGGGMQPTCAAAVNPFGAALKLMLGVAGFWNPPAGYAPTAPYTRISTAVDVIAGTTYVLEASAVVAPFTSLPNYAESPMAGPWNNWAVQIDMGG